jgi:hypothetical protein
MEHSAPRIEKQVSGTVSWREEMLGLGIIAAGLDTSVATQRATATPGESTLPFLFYLLHFSRDQNSFSLPEGKKEYM